MKGESLAHAHLKLDGIEGDRVLQVRNPRGKIVTARTRPGLLGHQATLGPDGVPRVDGRLWTEPAVLRDVQEAAGPGSTLTRDEGLGRFDILPLLVATDGAIQALGEDSRRLRPNLIIGGVDGLAERLWEGRELKIGEAVIQAVDLRERCVMTTFDPDSLEQDIRVLQRIHREFDGRLALNCAVITPGQISVGDPVMLRE